MVLPGGAPAAAASYGPRMPPSTPTPPPSSSGSPRSAPRRSAASPQQVRAAHVAGSPSVSTPGPPVQREHDAVVAGVPVRYYARPDARGLTVYLHGGGWVVGTLDTYAGVCRALAVGSGTSVVSVGYGLAPELRHPGQVEQCVRGAARDRGAARRTRSAWPATARAPPRGARRLRGGRRR